MKAGSLSEDDDDAIGTHISKIVAEACLTAQRVVGF